MRAIPWPTHGHLLTEKRALPSFPPPCGPRSHPDRYSISSTALTLVTSQRRHLQAPPHERLGAQHGNFGETQTLMSSQCCEFVMVYLRSSLKVHVIQPGELRGDRWEEMNSERRQLGHSLLASWAKERLAWGQGAVSRQDLALTPCPPFPNLPSFCTVPPAPAFQTLKHLIYNSHTMFDF